MLQCLIVTWALGNLIAISLVSINPPDDFF
jgi:hypothetical protein